MNSICIDLKCIVSLG